MIPQQFIDDLLRRIDVVEVVGQYVQLKRTGANYSGLCPFHTEKSPSFSVSPAKQFYHCFGCGAHGTALGFLIEHLGLPFPQAVEDLARRVGLEVPQETPRVDSEARKQETDYRARLKDRLLEAAKFYQRRLKDSPAAVAYLKGRGLSGEIAVRYHLGYAPEGWQPLQAVFGDYEHRELVDAGLVIEGDAGKRYDRFRDRIMFPILSARGEVLGFGARTLGADEPKYLNSPETQVFSKGFELYGVFEARPAIREAGEVWVVEGYMDVVALAQHGVGQAVATLGTATTPNHLQSLLRLSDHVVFMFDGDAAGRRAAARALETALPFASEKNRIDFVFLPTEHDPDSFVRERGADALREWVRNAKPLSACLLDFACQDQSLEFAEGRAAALAEVVRSLKLMPANPLRAQIVREAARRFDAEESAVLAQLNQSAAPRAGAPAGANAQSASTTPAVAQPYTPPHLQQNNSAPLFPAKGGRKPWSKSGNPVPIRLPRPVIRPLAERMLQILVRCPDWSIELSDAEVINALEPTQAELLEWIRDKARSGAATNFAVLHEAALAQGRERGSDAIKLFLKLSRPDPALDALQEMDTAELKNEYQRAISRLKVRLLEEEASRLVVLAATDPAALGALTQIRAKIKELKA
jgi:DNA primase